MTDDSFAISATGRSERQVRSTNRGDARMRFHVSSLSRAQQGAKSIKSLFEIRCRREIALTEAQHAYAQALGYDDWAELKRHAAGSVREPSPYDELMPMASLKERLAGQAAALVDAFGVPPEDAAFLVADLRLTASPGGPNVIAGPSSIVGPQSVEYRGHAPGYWVTAALEFGVLMAAQQCINWSDPDAPDAESIIENTSAKIFRRVEEEPIKLSISADADRALRRLAEGGIERKGQTWRDRFLGFFAGSRVPRLPLPSPVTPAAKRVDRQPGGGVHEDGWLDETPLFVCNPVMKFATASVGLRWFVASAYALGHVTKEGRRGGAVWSIGMPQEPAGENYAGNGAPTASAAAGVVGLLPIDFGPPR